MKKTMIIIIILLLFSTVQLVYALPQPTGIGGEIKINDVSVNGVQVTIKNINTGETQITTTKTNQQNKPGFYATVLNCLNDDKISITVSHNGLHTKITTVNFEQTTIWLNLSIETTSEPPGIGDENTSPNPDGNNAPVADFTYSPFIIYSKHIITFRDNSTDLDNDIISWTWTIEGNVFTGKIINYVFQNPGNHTVTLVVMDENNTMNIKQKIIPVLASEGEPEITGDNITIYLQVKDKHNNNISNALIEIYLGETLMQAVYTDSQGFASIMIPQGTYRLQTYYSNQYTSSTHTFYINEDNLVIYLDADGKNIIVQPTVQQETTNWILIGGVAISLCAILFLIIGRWRRWI